MIRDVAELVPQDQQTTMVNGTHGTHSIESLKQWIKYIVDPSLRRFIQTQRETERKEENKRAQSKGQKIEKGAASMRWISDMDWAMGFPSACVRRSYTLGAAS